MVLLGIRHFGDPRALYRMPREDLITTLGAILASKPEGGQNR